MYPTERVLGAAGVSAGRVSRARILLLFFPTVSLIGAILLGSPGAGYAPDSYQYRLLALGQRGAVPAPFSPRILGPALAGWLGRASGLGVDTGFFALGVVCLAALLGAITAYLWSWKAPVAIFAAVFLMPFWVDMFHDYYLPDLLHGALLAAILACLYRGYTWLGMLLLFPAFLARESTILVALCLVIAGWRRMPALPAVMGLLATASGLMASAHFSQGSPASIHGLSGGTYILGKLVWSFFKNFLGLPLWSNTLPECTPVWAFGLPYETHLGAIGKVGLCPPSLWGPGRLVLAWFGTFGLAAAFTVASWRALLLLLSAPQGRQTPCEGATGALPTRPGAILVFRFGLIYGLISILMTPLLGASADRLVAYGWPFSFGVLPWLIYRDNKLPRRGSAGLICLHLATAWLAWFGFKQQTNAYLIAAFAVLAANVLTYITLRRYRIGYLSA